MVLFWFLICSLCFEISSSHLVVLSSCLSFHFTEFMFLLFSFNLYFSVKHSWRIFFCALDYVFFKTGFFVFYAMLLVSVSLLVGFCCISLHSCHTFFLAHSQHELHCPDLLFILICIGTLSLISFATCLRSVFLPL